MREYVPKEQDKSPEIRLHEMQIKLSNKEFEVKVIKMFPEVKRAIREQINNFSRDRKH